MNKQAKIAPSIMCANFKHLEKDIVALNECGCEYLHFDIMDGAFVPNFTLGVDIMRHVREMTKIPFDIHLMVLKPEGHLKRFDIAPNDYVSFHYEACYHVERTLRVIKEEYGAKPMIALNPATPLNVLDYILESTDGVLIMTVNPGYAGQKLISATLKKIADLNEILKKRNLEHIEIEVDGNVSPANAKKMRGLGADIFVAGTSGVFLKDKPIKEACALLREAVL